MFDFERIRDRATILDPGRYPEGIDFVLVNGVPAVDNGEVENSLDGVVIMRSDS